MSRPRMRQRCLNAAAFAVCAAPALAIAHLPRLSSAAFAVALVALTAFLVLSIRSVRR